MGIGGDTFGASEAVPPWQTERQQRGGRGRKIWMQREDGFGSVSGAANTVNKKSGGRQ
jgi:hypothetical protein